MVPAGTMKIHGHTIRILRHNNKNTEITKIHKLRKYINYKCIFWISRLISTIKEYFGSAGPYVKYMNILNQ